MLFVFVFDCVFASPQKLLCIKQFHCNYIQSVLNVEPTVAITANYASSRRIPTIWDVLMEYDADPAELERYYCHILDKSQRDELVDYNYSCDFNDNEF